MRTPFDQRFAPITSHVAFLRGSLDLVTAALVEVRRRQGRSPVAKALSDPFPQVLHRLEPLVMSATPRELLVEVGGWVAWFGGDLPGGNHHLAARLVAAEAKVEGVALTLIPHTVDSSGQRGRQGAVVFQLFAPRALPNEILWVGVIRDGSKTIFERYGDMQEFEESARYSSLRKRDRLDSAMVERYCLALGIDAFNESAYGKSVLIESDVVFPRDPIVLSLQEAQRRYDIVPD